MSEENWKEAQTDFFESFRNYDEAGSLQRIQVLKYLVLTTMLMKSDINPFESQETKPYKNDSRISVMNDLVYAYQQNDIHSYEAILQKNKDILEDSFIAENIDEVTRSLRISGVLKLLTPYTRFSLEFIAHKLKIPIAEVQDIVAYLIIDKKLDAKIDQERGIVEINDQADADRTKALEHWTSAVDKLWKAVLNEGDGFRSDDVQVLGGTAMPGISLPGRNDLGGPGFGRPAGLRGGAGRRKGQNFPFSSKS